MAKPDDQWYAQHAKLSLERLQPRLDVRYRTQIQAQPKAWEDFVRRWQVHFERLFRLYHQLYGDHYDFFYHLENLLTTALEMWFERPEELKDLDLQREAEPHWFQSQQMVGGVCYVDLFAGDLQGIRQKIPYFEELGLTYLHLMPLFLSPEGENDGGYAVSSYREINPRLGKMEDLIELGRALREKGISLVLDFIFNHTSDEHNWAKNALAGDADFQAYYRMYPDRTLPDAYEAHLREIFPDEHPGAFTYHAELEKWVWTTFHTYQWDLNYANPVVFNQMVAEMLFLANAGVEVLRLDAVAFIWKQLGTSCENLPEAHALIQAFNAVVRIAAPAMLFKSEAIVHPDEVAKYIHPDECQISYNPLLMATLWNNLATRDTRLLKLALRERYKLNPECAWVNYVRSHDDIGWTFSDEDAAHLGINGFDHRLFLNDFFVGNFPGSFGRGLLFQQNPKTGDARISGTAASLAGLEKALREETPAEVELAIRRILVMYSVVMTAGGVPLIYLGDEIGMLNDYSYRDDPAKSDDSRWVHRPCFDWDKMTGRDDPDTLVGQIYQGMQAVIRLRKTNPVFACGDLEVMEFNNDQVLGYVRTCDTQRVIVLANFSESAQVVPANLLRMYGLSYTFKNLASGEAIPFEDLQLEPYEFVCLIA